MMTRSIRLAVLLATFAVLALVARTVTHAQAQQAPSVKRTVLLQHDTSMPGYEAVLVAVEIPAGGREGRHTHPGLAMIHVEEGTLTLDYEGKPTTPYKAGESFFVEAGKVHEGMNKGTTPVKAIATFVVPKGQPITTQVAAATK
ncbi:MAG TPA: cupin domain-containing protein [Vicinamibacterales bacterium]